MLTPSQPQPTYAARGFQVLVVDYESPDSLRFALAGVDIIISTVLGPAQLRLIEAAVRCRVGRFAPAEFEGPPRLRPAEDPLDRGRQAARQLLHHYRDRIQSTAFICGIFYERFQPGGLASARIGASSGFSGEGDYMLDIRNMTAQIPIYDVRGQNSVICMTTAQDVGRFVARAVGLNRWPSELVMSGERISVYDLLVLVQNAKGKRAWPEVDLT
jgi:hypothetical protein